MALGMLFISHVQKLSRKLELEPMCALNKLLGDRQRNGKINSLYYKLPQSWSHYFKELDSPGL